MGEGPYFTPKGHPMTLHPAPWVGTLPNICRIWEFSWGGHDNDMEGRTPISVWLPTKFGPEAFAAFFQRRNPLAIVSQCTSSPAHLLLDPDMVPSPKSKCFPIPSMTGTGSNVLLGLTRAAPFARTLHFEQSDTRTQPPECHHNTRAPRLMTSAPVKPKQCKTSGHITGLKAQPNGSARSP